MDILDRLLVFFLTVVPGMLAGRALYTLPDRLFYRGLAYLTQEEFVAAHPGQRWVTWAVPVLCGLGFFLFMFLAIDPARVGVPDPVGWFFFPLTFMAIIGAVPAVPELVAGATVLIPFGLTVDHGPRRFACSPNPRRAAGVRLTASAVVIAAFLWCR